MRNQIDGVEMAVDWSVDPYMGRMQDGGSNPPNSTTNYIGRSGTTRDSKPCQRGSIPRPGAKTHKDFGVRFVRLRINVYHKHGSQQGYCYWTNRKCERCGKKAPKHLFEQAKALRNLSKKLGTLV